LGYLDSITNHPIVYDTEILCLQLAIPLVQIIASNSRKQLVVLEIKLHGHVPAPKRQIFEPHSLTCLASEMTLDEIS
jgi:hypothetical protein